MWNLSIILYWAVYSVLQEWYSNKRISNQCWHETHDQYATHWHTVNNYKAIKSLRLIIYVQKSFFFSKILGEMVCTSLG